MTDERFDISRRKALAALGTIGVASAGAGLGTSAYFSDQETFENNSLTAGTLDMKVAATEYYSDWSSDEADLAGMASDADSTDIRLPPGEDQSDAQAIALDLDDDYDGDGDVYGAFFETISSDENGNPYNRVNDGVAAASDGLCGTESDADGPVIIDIGDVKPGDFGGAQFAFELCDNPGYVWLTGGLRDANENGTTEPEADDPDEEDDVVELLDEIQVAYSVGAINDDPSGFEDTDSGFQPVEQYTLREFLDRISNQPGTELSDGTMNAELGGGTGEQGCFAGSPENGSAVHQVSVVWWLPINHGNQVQSDSVTFDLGFYTEQCRHNAGASTVYNDFYQHFNSRSSVTFTDPDEVASWAYAANNADAFGAVVGFEPNSSREMQSASFLMSNWNGWNPDGGPGNATESYRKELTLELYKVDRSGSEPAAGQPIDTFTQEQTIAGRELPDPDSGYRGGGGTIFEVEFDLGGVTLPDEVLFMISFDYPNTGEAPEDSLNLAATSTGTNRDPTTGRLVDPSGVYWRPNNEIQRFEAGAPFAKFSAVGD
jgi:predicted ribosomally synthesized peptide with SipW-like signal peptide